jgi:type IX secretion system PorP/SprF family membrane protein
VAEGRKYNGSILKFAKVILLLIWGSHAWGQDLHWTQYWGASLQMSPANNGLGEGDFQLQTSCRSQWKGVSGVPYQTQWIQAEWKKVKQSKWSSGLGIARDIAGDGQWRQLQILGNLARVFELDSGKTIFSLGTQLRYNQWQWDPNAWQWGSQWNGAYYDPNLPSLENQMSAKTSFSSLNMGGAWRQQWTNSLKSQVTWGSYHLWSTHWKMLDQENSVSMRHAITLNMEYDWKENWTFRYTSSMQKQGIQKEMTHWLMADYFWNKQPWNLLCLQSGLGFRNQDAVMLFSGLKWKQHQLGLSYDWNISRFRIATEYRGGWELHYGWLLNKIPIKQPVRNVCPDYY